MDITNRQWINNLVEMGFNGKIIDEKGNTYTTANFLDAYDPEDTIISFKGRITL